MKTTHHTHQPARKGLRLWLVCARAKPVMLPGFWSHRKARADAKALAARGLAIRICRGREILREVRPTTAALSRTFRLAA